MEELNRLIKDVTVYKLQASNEFQCHNFKTSLSLYLRCIEKCVSGQFPKYILYNLISAQAGLRSVLGDYETALSVLNDVLSRDKQHWGCLFRRSQIYKKQKKYKKALQDLQILSMYAPDNMQIAAFKLQLNTLIIRDGNNSSQDSSESEQQISKQEEMKLFAKLKKIDRCSVSIMLPKARQSQVTITGSQKYIYEQSKSQRKPKQQISLPPQKQIRQKYIEVEQELEKIQNQQENQPTQQIVITSAPIRTKSILKNRNSALYIQQHNNSNSLISSPQGKKLIQKLQNIDGHIIQSDHCSSNNFSQKSVQFGPNINEQHKATNKRNKNKKPSSRKSCLKHSSLALSRQTVKSKNKHYQKYLHPTRSSIDNQMIRSDSVIYQIKQEQVQKQNVKANGEKQSENDSQVGSHFNIFGSTNVVMNEELRENLGLGSGDFIQLENYQNNQKNRKHSILKKSSIIGRKQSRQTRSSNQCFKERDQNQFKVQRRPKKSVMFMNC